MNKKAFTLIEIILVIVIIGAILLFAIPSVTQMIENGKKETMLIDAKEMVQKTKNYIMSGKDSYPQNQDEERKYILKNIDPKNEIKESPFGSPYDRLNSFVLIKKDGSTYKISVTLKDKKENKIKTDEKELSGDDRYSKVEIKE